MLLSSTLVETHTVAGWDHTNFRVIETGQSSLAFEAGHIPGSLFWDMHELLTPDYCLRTDPGDFAALLSRSGVTPETTVVCSFQGEPEMTTWAAWLFWIFTGVGHGDTVILNGGTGKWRVEARPFACHAARPQQSSYPRPGSFSETHRAFHERVRATAQLRPQVAGGAILLDARSAQEFVGEHFIDAPPLPAERAGHIPGARHLPHGTLVQEDGCYRPVDELHTIAKQLKLRDDREVITYCTAGIRSALLWFALWHLLGFGANFNYDGAWNEWSRLIEKAGADDH